MESRANLDQNQILCIQIPLENN